MLLENRVALAHLLTVPVKLGSASRLHNELVEHSLSENKTSNNQVLPWRLAKQMSVGSITDEWLHILRSVPLSALTRKREQIYCN